MIGKTISHYKINEKLGEGGMGVVYKAEDTKLKRTVALKFLPSELTCDPEAKARFIREAQAASALEHPSICNIHEISETDDGQIFIVMACYEGQTLKEKISIGSIDINEAIEIAIQIGQGLSRAHEEGIVHRDIKPANIIITDRDEVKILDFGLAKLVGKVQLTKDSTTLGTVAYMSPEQLSGKDVDQRTDIWSIGVILYEMLTSELPFKGDYEQAIIYSILNEDPKSLLQSKYGIKNKTREIELVVNKALNKDRNKRYHDIGHIIDDLKSIKNTPDNLTTNREHLKQKPKFLFYTTVAILTLILLIVVYWAIIPEKEIGYRIKHTFPLTTAPGLEQAPSWSPEGSRIAYASDENGNMDIWIRQIAAGQNLNLTKNYTGYDGKPAWSPDGEWIAFISERDGGGVFLISALGGIPKRIVSLSFAVSHAYMGAIPTICWSPDGKELVYASAGNLFKISADGGKPDSIPLPPHRLVIGYIQPAWSPDGERIACTGLVGIGVTTTQIWTIRHDGTDPISITSGKTFDINPVWSSDGEKIFFITDRGGIKDVWWMPVTKKGKSIAPAQPITVGVGIGDFALSRDGMHLSYTKMNDQSNIWSIPVLNNSMVSLNQATAVTEENHFIEIVAISPDTQWIAFDSNRNGNQDIWIMRKNGSDLRQLTTHTAHDWAPDWSPDGTKIVFHSFRQGNRDLYVKPVAGGATVPLTNHPEQDFLPRWSPDGEKITFFSSRSGNLDIWIIPSKGGEPKQLTHHQGQDQTPIWSPDGKHIAFTSKRFGLFDIFIKAINEGETIQLTQYGWESIQVHFWSSNGKMIYASGSGGPENSRLNYWEISIEDGSIRPLLNTEGSAKEPYYRLASDGKRFYFPLWERIGDIWKAELSLHK